MNVLAFLAFVVGMIFAILFFFGFAFALDYLQEIRDLLREINARQDASQNDVQ